MSTKLKNFKEAPFYFSPLFLVLVSAFSFFIIPFFIAIILVCLRSRRYVSIESSQLIELENIQEQIATASERLQNLQASYTEKNKELEDQYAQKNKHLENEYIQRKEILDKEHQHLSKELAAKTKQEKSVLEAIKKSVDEILITPELDTAIYEEISSAEIKNKLALLATDEQELQKEDRAVFTTSGAQDVTQSALRKQKNQLLRSFNSETESLIRSVTVRNLDNIRQKITRSFEAHNKLFAIDNVQLSKEFLELKLLRMTCFYAYQKKLQEEKELLQVQKEQLREEEKVRHELEMARKKIEKDENQFKHEIERTMKYLQNSSMDAEKQLYIDKIRELNEKLEQLSKDKENINQREANAKAGYVYIISNIGSFGENIFKIGMTRRLEPLDRIKELSSASVPFDFDVHALIFSDDAPALEALLHQEFRNLEVNKVNHRKEFFKVTLSNIEKLVKEKYDKAVTFIEIPKAEEYRESHKLLELKSPEIN